MIDELILHQPRLRERGNPATPLLIVCSVFREDLPWLYEIASQFARAYERADRGELISLERAWPIFTTLCIMARSANCSECATMKS